MAIVSAIILLGTLAIIATDLYVSWKERQ
ncbi:hypothetical protein SPHINGOAX6_70568 [Sphingomonas sp. AX6]|nr:hypothetical protein SPHINGOAX6_70568 [Sphingomonas sp. AX6]